MRNIAPSRRQFLKRSAWLGMNGLAAGMLARSAQAVAPAHAILKNNGN
jgi:hypothetical protein